MNEHQKWLNEMRGIALSVLLGALMWIIFFALAWMKL